MTGSIWKFIEGKFDNMPIWVQVIVYLVLVLVLIVLIFNPKYIDIRLISNSNGEQYPLKNAIVEVEVGDRVLYMQSDEKGRFSVPVSFANPGIDYTFILRPDLKNKDKIKDVIIPGKAAYKRWSKLIYHENNDSCQFLTNNSFSISNIFPGAYAQVRDSDINNTQLNQWLDNGDSINTRGIAKNVIEIVSKAGKINKKRIRLDSKLILDLEFGNIELSYLNHLLEENHGVGIWDDIWNETTVEDVVKIVVSAYYKYYGIESVNNRFVTTLDIELWNQQNMSSVNYQYYQSAKRDALYGNTYEAVRTFEAIARSSPEVFSVWLDLANIYDQVGAYDFAEECYHNAINAGKSSDFISKDIYTSYGKFLDKHGRHGEALVQFQQALSIEPDSLGFGWELISLSHKIGSK